MSLEREIQNYLKSLRDHIVRRFESLEPTKRFTTETWPYQNGTGGGEMTVLRGDVFEKAAVNFSAVSGDTFPGSDAKGPFFATGISIITHMKNPHAPTVHFNIRFIKTHENQWLGGGYDLTPMGFFYDEDKKHFHDVAKHSLDPHGKHLYPLFSEQARKYFTIEHRNKERGVGGIFFDHYKTDNWNNDLAMWKAVGDSFTDTIMPIYHKRIDTPYTDQDRDIQLEYRGHYVEFNLVYDRGTQFGFKSKGNTKAILCSLPPLAAW
jgi:coproporphyrinogen III oxidase